MDSKLKNKFTLIIAASLLLALISAVFLFISYKTSFSYDIRHFVMSPALVIMGVSLVLSLLSALGAAIFIRRRFGIRGVPGASSFGAFSYVICGVFAAALGAQTLYANRFFLLNKSVLLSTISAILALISAVYFVLSVGGEKFRNARMYLSFAPLFWQGFRLLTIYFSTDRAINDPSKSLDMLVAAALLLFFCEDVRYFIDRQSAALSYFFTLTACACTIAVGIPTFVLCVSGSDGFSTIIGSASIIAFMLLTFSRLTELPAMQCEYVGKKPASSKNKGKHCKE